MSTNRIAKRVAAGQEPLVTRATIVATVAAVIGVLVAFGVPLGEDQQQAIMSLVAVLAPVAVALVARRKVTPVE